MTDEASEARPIADAPIGQVAVLARLLDEVLDSAATAAKRAGLMPSSPIVTRHWVVTGRSAPAVLFFVRPFGTGLLRIDPAFVLPAAPAGRSQAGSPPAERAAEPAIGQPIRAGATSIFVEQGTLPLDAHQLLADVETETVLARTTSDLIQAGPDAVTGADWTLLVDEDWSGHLRLVAAREARALLPELLRRIDSLPDSF